MKGRAEMSEQLDIKEEFVKNRAVFKVAGEIDIYTVQIFKERLYALINKVAGDKANDAKTRHSGGKNPNTDAEPAVGTKAGAGSVAGIDAGLAADSAGVLNEVAVDCRDLKYIDSTGLGVLVGALKLARQKGVSMLVRNLKDNIRKLFDITSLDKVFIIEKD